MSLRIAREMEAYRRPHPMYMGMGDRGCGFFEVPARGLRIIAASDGGWDHVSVSLRDRCPTWEEMQWVRSKFFEPGDTVLQYSPPEHLHISVHPYCLHLWRPQEFDVPLPPSYMIA